jgi:SAM-dependent methyltransferase
MPTQQSLDRANAQFWDELCGTQLARSIGITDHTAESLARFDRAYLGRYPYLLKYVPDRSDLEGKRTLEIGLGFGTLGQVLAERGADYQGLDIAEGPVALMRSRLDSLGLDGETRVDQGSVVEMPSDSESFQFVFSIGCLHHTGDIPRAVSEIRRVLAPGGRAIVMLYNRRSFRQFAARLRARLSGRKLGGGELRGRYDRNVEGEAAPFTEFVTKSEARALFSGFREVKIDVQNFDPQPLLRGKIRIPRERLLGNLARVVGLDLYIVAVK